MTTWSNVTSAYWWWPWYHIFQTGWNHQLESVFFCECVSVSEYFLWKIFFGQRIVVVRSVLGVLVDWWAWVSKTEKHRDVWCFCMKHAQFRPQTLLEREVISLNVLCLQIDDHQQYEEMFISYAHPFMGVWRVGYQRAKGIIELTKLNDLTILWNGGTAVWWYDPSSMSHVALPGFLHEFCWQAEDENWWEVWWIWVCWVRFSHVLVKEIHDAWGKENYIYMIIYVYVCVYIYIYVYTNWSKLFVPFRRDSVCLTLADI